MISFTRTVAAIWFCISISSEGLAQYFQQEVNYVIAVTLNPKRHVLLGHWEMMYQNNSPDTLQKIVMHLYPNAYSSRNTAFAKQQLRLGITDFHFAEVAERGAIDSLDFRVNQERIAWSLDVQHPDIATLNLNTPLLPGQSIRISSPIRVTITNAFSRMGRIGDSYQITQWYPKPAVYDQDGWHPLPYLNQGEFYSEFSSFDVTISLPDNYIVAATGVLQSPEELHLLDSLANAKNSPEESFPALSPAYRSWRYRADQVHDFAWFADTRFAVRKETINIGGKSVDCWAFFTTTEQQLWEHATGYLADAVRFYSEQLDTYPYGHMTAVQVPLGKDFGMEYPMITSINMVGDAKTLDDVLAHEVGHNWFYGALGSNERKHPWMDEGINTFYEFDYLRVKYQEWSEHILLHKPVEPDALSDEQRILQHMTREKQLVAPDTDPEFMTDLQVFFCSYFKPALAFDMLQSYMGEPVFQEAMQQYYSQWKFRHPHLENLQSILEQHCSCNLSWLFEGLLGTDRLIDYRIKDLNNNRLSIENRGSITAPLHILAYRGTEVIFEKWYDGFEGTHEFPLDISGADRLQIYDELYTLDATPSNNVLFVRSNAIAHTKLKLRFLGGKQYPGEQYLNVLPVFSWNHTDKEMLGLVLSNTYWPPGKLQWAVVPLYSFKTKMLTGLGEIQYRHVSPHKPHAIEFGLGVKSFHYLQDTHYGFFDRYLKVAPRIGFEFFSMVPSSSHKVQYRFVFVEQQYGRGIDFNEGIWENEQRSYSIHELKYFWNKKGALASSHLEGTLHAGQGFVRIFADLRQYLSYRKPGKGLYIHAFAGALPVHDGPKANVLFNFNGIQSNGFFSRDYLYDELLFARNATKGLVSQFVFLKDAQLKTLFNGGISDRWMLAAGLSTDTPLPIPIQPYFDIAVYNDPFEDGVALNYSGGLALVVKKHVFEMYFPLIESKDIRNSLTYLDRDTFIKRISILLDLNAFHPFKYKGY